MAVSRSNSTGEPGGSEGTPFWDLVHTGVHRVRGTEHPVQMEQLGDGESVTPVPLPRTG